MSVPPPSWNIICSSNTRTIGPPFHKLLFTFSLSDYKLCGPFHAKLEQRKVSRKSPVRATYNSPNLIEETIRGQKRVMYISHGSIVWATWWDTDSSRVCCTSLFPSTVVVEGTSSYLVCPLKIVGEFEVYWLSSSKLCNKTDRLSNIEAFCFPT